MESVQEVLDEMQQLASETMANCLHSTEISATTIDAALLVLKPGAAWLQKMIRDITWLGRTSHFTLFPKLPVEIRLKIWREALPGPRIIDVCLDVDYGECDYESYKASNGGFMFRTVLRANQPPPVVFHVCSESRRESLRILSQIGKIDPQNSLYYSWALLDLSKDTLLMPQVAGSESNEQRDIFGSRVLTDETFDNLKYLAIDCSIWSTLSRTTCLTKFKNLFELSIVFEKECEFEIEQVGEKREYHWRMPSTTFELVQVDASSSLALHLETALTVIHDLKAVYQNWREPKVVIKALVRRRQY